jgi:hypothetical protein
MVEAREPSKEDIAARLHAADYDISEADLTRMLRRLVDCGQLEQVRKSDAAPIHYVTSSSLGEYSVTDSVEADICAVLRAHNDATGYEDEDQLRGWLREIGTEVDDHTLGKAIGHLFYLRHLNTPRADQWERPGEAIPTWLVEPRIYTDKW